MSNEYEIIGNREEGKGRCDIMIKAELENLSSYIFEFKYVSSPKEVKRIELQEIAK